MNIQTIDPPTLTMDSNYGKTVPVCSYVIKYIPRATSDTETITPQVRP